MPKQGIPSIQFDEAATRAEWKIRGERKVVESSIWLGSETLSGLDMMLGLKDGMITLFPEGAHLIVAVGIGVTQGLVLEDDQGRRLYSAYNSGSFLLIQESDLAHGILSPEQTELLVEQRTAL